jgi:hypothetical protein
MNHKLTLNSLLKLARARGGTLLATKYNNIKGVLEWECQNSHKFQRTPFDVKYLGYWCPQCSGRHSEQDYASWAQGIKAEYLGLIRVKGQKRLRLQCQHGHAWLAAPSHTKKGHGCPECAGLKPFTLKDAQRFAKEKDGVCLSTRYVNANSKLRWRCAAQHEWETTLASIKNTKSWCPTCANKSAWRWRITDAVEVANRHGGHFVSDNFTKRGVKYSWQCKNHHSFTMEFDAVLKGRWCPKCKFKTEQRVRELFEKLTNESFPQRSPKWLINKETGGRMRLDGYCEKLKLAFEYDGEFHFMESPYFSSTLRERQERDRLKDLLCTANGVALIRISFRENPEEVIVARLKKRGIIKI